jgi:hypothetical protein
MSLVASTRSSDVEDGTFIKTEDEEIRRKCARVLVLAIGFAFAFALARTRTRTLAHGVPVQSLGERFGVGMAVCHIECTIPDESFVIIFGHYEKARLTCLQFRPCSLANPSTGSISPGLGGLKGISVVKGRIHILRQHLGII